MNILPKKRWHVRTKENIARVRKDEAEAAEKERQEQLRIEAADREARLSVLKYKSKQKLLEAGITEREEEVPTVSEHINLFADLDKAIKNTNKEHDKEVKDKTEEYEKKIGYLTYLGQDTNEALGKKNWYEVAPESSRFSRSNEIKDTYDKLVLKDPDGRPKKRELDEKDGEIGYKQKQLLDPLNAFRKYCPKTIKNAEPKKDYSSVIVKHKDTKKKHKNDIVDKKEMLQKLREARSKREMEERRKTELFLMQRMGIPTSSSKKESEIRVKPKYNSQFNPELARQNYK